MLMFGLLLAALQTACASPPEGSEVRHSAAIEGNERVDDLTNAFIEMDHEGVIRIYYDDKPTQPERILPPSHRMFIELAGGLEPGQRKRLSTPVMRYAVDAPQRYVLFTWAQAPNVVSEPATVVIDESMPVYACYAEALAGVKSSPGHHYMTLAEHREIEACTEALPKP